MIDLRYEDNLEQAFSFVASAYLEDNKKGKEAIVELSLKFPRDKLNHFENLQVVLVTLKNLYDINSDQIKKDCEIILIRKLKLQCIS